MEFLADYGIVVTTYEISKDKSNSSSKGDEEDNYNPVITHIGWGNNIRQALNYLKSHLKSDYFFNSTFNGEMKWNNKVLRLAYEGKVINITPISRKKDLENDIFDESCKRNNNMQSFSFKIYNKEKLY